MIMFSLSAVRPGSAKRGMRSARLRRMLLGAALVLGVVGMCAPALQAQTTSPLTIQPSPTNRVGIRTADPQSVLSVVGDGTDVPYLDIANTGNVKKLIVAPSGNVGVGTGTPNASGWGTGTTVTTIEGTDWGVLELAGHRTADNQQVGGLVFHNRVTDGGAIAAVSGDRLGNNHAGYLRFYVTPSSSSPGSLTQMMYLDETGIYITGVKSFEIEHPLDPTKRLVHAAIEGPEVGVYYRGEAQLKDGQAVVELPAYFEALTTAEQRSVQLTPVDGWSPLYVEGGVHGGKLVVRTAKGGNAGQKFFWEVKAIRKTATPLQVEREKATGAGAPRVGLSTSAPAR